MLPHFYLKRNHIASFIALLVVFSASILRGQTQYIGANNGDWATATNWNNGLPSPTNAPTVGGGVIVCLNGTLTLNYSISNFGKIINKGTTTLAGNLIGGCLDNQSVFTVAVGAQANINAGFTNSGTFNNSGATNINTVAGSNAALGTINNEGSWEQLSPFANNGLLDCKVGVFNSSTAITNNKTLEVRSGATYKVDFGGSFVNATGSIVNNAGNLSNLGTFTNNTTFNNRGTGTYTNNGTHDCLGILNNESGALITSTATMNFTGQLNNKLGATVTSGNNFVVKSGGFVSNIGTFNNNNLIDVKLGGTFNNDATGIVNLGFGSTIVNGGYVKTLAGSKITGNGSITNNKKLESYGLIESNNGAAITNTDTLCNFGTIKNVNTVSNSKYWKNSGMLDNNSGGVLTNTGNFENFKGATVSNNYEVFNKPAAIMTNNGTFANAIRLFNEGLFTNNAYLVTTGEIYNRVGGTLTNTEVIEIKEGAIINEGTINNQKLFFNNSCSVISNKSTINNTGRLESWGLVFQRGTVTGTQIVSNAGYVHTGATSNAPSICRDTVKTGVDPDGEAKVYGQNPLLPNLGIDACNGFQYAVNNTSRAVFPCSNVGQTFPVPFVLLTRTGDSLTCTLQISVFDPVPPIISGCPKDVTIITDQNAAIHTWTAPTAVDNCAGTPVFASTKASGSSFPLGLTEVIITAKDVSNVQAECRFKVNVRKIVATGTCAANDAAGPVFGNCPVNQTLATQTGSAVAVWNEPSVSDACLPIVSCASANSGQRFPVGTTTVTYTATDSKNNPSTCSFTVTVTGSSNPCATDNILPVISNCAGNFFTTLNPAINGGVGVWATPSASDNCGAVTLTSNFQTGTIFPAGNTVVTYTAKDAKNNTSTCSFTVNVAATNPCAGDVTPPSITCPANIAVNTTTNGAIATWAVPTATDNCGTPSVNATHAPGQTFEVGVTTVTYAASDANGNRKTCTFTVTVNNACFSDTTSPVLVNCPANQTLSAGANGTATATWTAPTATDNCTLAGITSNYASGSAFATGTTTVVYTATDNSGNKGTCTFSITVGGTVNPCATDVTPPVLSACPANLSLTTATTTAIASWTAPTATDVCGTPSVSFVTSPTIGLTNGGAFPVGTTTVTYTATDAQNNKSTCTFTVTVTAQNLNDICVNPAANIVGGANSITITGITTSAALLQVFSSAWAPILNQQITGTTYTVPNLTAGGYIVKVSVLSAGGFWPAVCDLQQNVTVTSGVNPCTTDVTAPVFSACPANLNLTTTATTATATWTAPTATDNCGTPSVSFATSPIIGLTNGGAFPIGATTVTYTATDAKNNKSTCVITVTVVKVITDPCATDVTAPVLSACPTNLSLTTTTTSAVAAWVSPTATDNCGTPSVSYATSPTVGLANGTAFPVGTTTVTYTATDAKGNKSTCTFTVTVTAPVTGTGICTNPTANIVGGANAIAITGITTSSALLQVFTSAWAPILNQQIATSSFTIPNLTAGAYIVKVTVLGSGGVWPAVCDLQQNVTVTSGVNPCATDVTAPILSVCPANLNLTTPTNTAIASWTAPTATDNCGTPSVSFATSPTIGLTNGGAFPVGTTTVTYTATDAKNNKSTCSFTVTVTKITVDPCATDVTLPVITCPVNQTVNQNATCSSATWAPATATDNCGIPTVAQISGTLSGGCFPLGTSTVTYKATDGKGFQAICSFNITVVNNCAALANSAVTEYLVNGVWSVGSSVTVEAGTSLTISANPNSLASYAWTGPNGFTGVGNIGGDVLVSSAISVAQSGVYTVVLRDANNCTATKSITVNVTPKAYSLTNCNANGEQLIFKGAIDYLAIGNTMSQSEDRSNCAQNAMSSRILTLPVGAVVKAAYLYWSGSGAPDNSVSLNGTNVSAQGSKTFYEPALGISFFAARANVTNLVRNSGNFTVSNLTWNNTGNYCQANSAYGAWSLAVVYEQVTLPYSTIHINTDKFQYTYPAANYNSYINCVKVPTGVASNAKLTIIAFEGDNYKGENLFIGGVNRGNNNFRGQSGPNLDILTFDVASVVTPATTSLNYYVQSYLTSTIWGNAVEGIFDYVKILKYNTGTSVTALASNTNRDVLQLEAAREGNKARIEWINNTGAKNDYFILEKLNASGVFEKLERINNKSATDDNEQYATYDNDPTEGDNTYRTTVVYLDGSTRVSDTKTLTFKGIESINLFPNPANDYVDVDLKKFNGLAVTVSVYNQFGILVQSKQVEKASSAPLRLEFGDTATGAYLIRVQAQGKREVTRKLQIAH